MRLPHVLSGLVTVLLAGPGLARAQTIERVDVGPGGVEAAGFQDPYVSISDDGRFVAYCSGAPNLVAGDTNNKEDIFVCDRSLGVTLRASVDSAGTQSNGHSFRTVISRNGRFVLYSGNASNLVAGDTNGVMDVFVHDLQTAVIERVSVDSAGVQGDGSSDGFSISSDGRFVAFASLATNLVAGDTNGQYDCFVHDRQTGLTERINVSSSGVEGNGGSTAPVLTSDGRFVAFGSVASNLVTGDTNGKRDIFLHDRQTGLTERVSLSSGGVQGDNDSNGSDLPWMITAISPDGRFVVFPSLADNLVPGDTNNKTDVFLRDRLSGTTERVSIASYGGQANLPSTAPGISPDGRYILFRSQATNLVPGDTNGYDDFFVHDRLSGSTVRVSNGQSGVQGNGPVQVGALTPDGRFLAFVSIAANLVPGDTNFAPDIFVTTFGALPVVAFCTAGLANVIACPCSNPPSGAGRGCENSSATGGATLGASGTPSLAADTLVFATAAENPAATSIVVQGTSASYTGFVFGQGVRCVGGSLKRLYLKSAAGGAILAPGAGDPSVSGRSMALGDAIQAGEHRYYMVQYRDPLVLGGCSPASTFNATQALDVPWLP